MAEIGNLNVRITGDNADLNQALNESSKGVNSFAKTTATALGSLGASFAVFGALVKGIDFNKAAESAKVAFTVMTGSAKTAEKTLKELKDFANKTPLEFKDIRDATQTLLQFGISAEDATDTIKMLGDVSAGDGQKLQQLALVFGQISSTGKLMGQDLLQLINVGFNPLQEIAKTTGRSMADLKKDMEKGLITFDMVKESFRTATGENGLFNNMLAKQADTLNGKLSTMNDALETAAGSATESLMPALKGLADITTVLAGGFVQLPAGVQAFTAAIAGLGAAALAAIPIIKMMGFTLSASFGPIAAITAGVIALGVGVAAAFNDYQLKTIERYKEEFKGVAAETGVAEEQMDVFAKQTQKVLGSLGALFSTAGPDKIEEIAKTFGMTTDQVARIGLASDKINPKIKEMLRGFIDINVDLARSAQLQKETWAAMDDYYAKKYPAVKKAQDEAAARAKAEKEAAEAKAKADAEAAKKKVDDLKEELALYGKTEKEKLKIAYDKDRALLMSQKDTKDAIKALDKKYADDVAEIEKEEAKKKQAILDADFEREKKLQDDLDKLNADARKKAEADTEAYNKKIIEEEKKLAEEKKAIWDASWDAFGSIMSGIVEIVRNTADAQIQALDEQEAETIERLENGGMTRKEALDKELADAIAAGDEDLANEKRIEIEKLKVTQDFEKKKAKLKYDADMFAWGASLAQAVANAALAITNIWATWAGNPIVAGILTGISAAATGVEIAAINSSRPQPPKLWTGTTNPIASSAPYIVGDQGVEMVLPKGAEVLNNRDTMGMLGGGGSQSMVVQLYLDGAKVSENVVNYINNGLVRLEMA